MNRHLLVFDDGSGGEIDLQAFVERLDEGAEIYTLDGHVCFLKTSLSAPQVSERFMALAGSSLFFVSDITSSPSGGRMVGRFWDFIKQPALSAAAE